MENFEKIENEDVENWKVREKLVDSVRETLDDYVAFYERDLYECMIDCESPIEQLMALELYSVNKLFSSVTSQIEILRIKPQEYIQIEKQTYKVDFMVNIAFKILDKYEDDLNLVIECDGYEFHQKTKEQVKKDYERDRLLQMAGYYVLRFGGSEIYNNPFECRKKINQFISNKYYQFLESKLKKNV